MKVTKVNEWLSLTANIGVLIGIVFLAFELSQNNRLMESEARLNQGDRVQQSWEEVYLNPHLADLLAKYSSGEALTPSEQIQFEAFQRRQLMGFQFQFEEFANGALDTINLNAWRRIYRGDSGPRPPLKEAWERSRNTMRPEFAEFFETNVVNY